MCVLVLQTSDQDEMGYYRYGCILGVGGPSAKVYGRAGGIKVLEVGMHACMSVWPLCSSR